MKKLLLTAVLLIALASSVYAYCSTDWTCMSDCQARGYMYGYCKSICTWCTDW